MVRLALLLCLVGCSARGVDRLQYIAEHTKSEIIIDGKDTERSWQRAALSPPFIATEGGQEVHGEARARMLWDDRNLYVFVNVTDRDVTSRFQQQDDPLWEADCIELFIDADGNHKGYIELQVSPQNTHFDAWFPVTRAQPHNFGWDAVFRSVVTVDGTLNKSDDRDNGWNVEISIPFGEARGGDLTMDIDVPPRDKSTWRMNVVRIDEVKGQPIRASSWAPIPVQDYHAIDRLMTVTFARSLASL